MSTLDPAGNSNREQPMSMFRPKSGCLLLLALLIPIVSALAVALVRATA